MTTNHDALPVAWLRPSVAPHYYAPATHWGAKPPEPLSADEALICGWFPVFKWRAAQPMPEAAAQGWKAVLYPITEEMHIAAVKVLQRASGIDGLPQRMLDAMLSASPSAPEVAKPEREIERLIRERDQRDEIIDRLCDAVLGSERPEWSSAYGFDDAVADVEERIAQLHQPSVDKAWERFEQANAAQPPHPQPQAQPTLSPDDIHSCGELCDLPECVAAREAQAQGDPSLPPLPEGKAVVRGPVSAFNNPESGSLVDFDCEGPLSHCPDDGEELFTADQVLSYGAECVQSHREAVARHRAALVACVGALKLAMHWAGPAMERDMRSPSNSQWMVEKTQAQEDSIYAAITHANQVLKGEKK